LRKGEAVLDRSRYSNVTKPPGDPLVPVGADGQPVLPEALWRTLPAVVHALLVTLLQENATLRGQVAALQTRVKALEDRLALDSHNSGKPPSSDPGRARPRPRSLRPGPGETGRRAGGQPGHPGTTLRLVETPDRQELHRPPQCRGCGAALAGGAERLDAERRQVVDLPPLALEVVEHRVVHVTCPACGVETAGTFPAGVTQPVQYGDRLKAVAVYLHDYQLVPYARTCEILDDLFQAAPCEATVQAAEATCSDGLAATEAAIKRALQQAAVAHFDETGLRVHGGLQWLHVASTATLTHYGVHGKRGTAATNALGILPAFTGTAVHDAWASYFTYTACAHALCNAHLLRELVYLHEQEHQAWADELATLLVTAKDLVDQARAAGQPALDALTLATLEAHYDHLLAQGRAANPALAPPPGDATGAKRRGRKKQTKAQNLLDRLTTHRAAVLAFMHDFRVPFDNNLAERDLRMLKVQQKIAGGFRSKEGAEAFARIRGSISTLRKQGQPVLAAIEAVFAGHPLVPSFTPG
jgi:transposase